MILRVDEDCVIGTSRHARLAANADRFVEIDNTVRALEHRRRRASRDARRVGALIAARDLMGAPRLRKDTHVDVLDVGTRYADGYDVFRFAGGRACVTADAARVVYDLGPLHAIIATW